MLFCTMFLFITHYAGISKWSNTSLIILFLKCKTLGTYLGDVFYFNLDLEYASLHPGKNTCSIGKIHRPSINIGHDHFGPNPITYIVDT